MKSQQNINKVYIKDQEQFISMVKKIEEECKNSSITNIQNIVPYKDLKIFTISSDDEIIQIILKEDE